MQGRGGEGTDRPDEAGEEEGGGGVGVIQTNLSLSQSLSQVVCGVAVCVR